MLMNRKVIVRLFFGEVYEGILRKSEVPDFLHVEAHLETRVVHLYIPVNNIKVMFYSKRKGRKIVEASIVNYSREN